MTRTIRKHRWQWNQERPAGANPSPWRPGGSIPIVSWITTPGPGTQNARTGYGRSSTSSAPTRCGISLPRSIFSPADVAWVERLHDPGYIQRVQAACRAGSSWIDTPDSAICPSSYDVALLAVGGVLAAVDAVMENRVENAFCAVRPPGHHAEPGRSMGFCLFNHVAIGAEYALAHHGLDRVAIVDFDVHHGNGTQHLFESRRDVLFISLHQDPATLYPGSGFAREIGHGDGEGYTVNLPVAPGSGDDDYQRLFEDSVLPRLNRFEPGMLLVSAGFDAAREDPLAQVGLTPVAYAWMTHQLRSVARRHSGGRLVSVLEGGYDLASLADCVVTHLKALI